MTMIQDNIIARQPKRGYYAGSRLKGFHCAHKIGINTYENKSTRN